MNCVLFYLLLVELWEVSQEIILLDVQPHNKIHVTISGEDQYFLSIDLTCETQGWCALGFGEDMAGSDGFRIFSTEDGVSLEDIQLYSKYSPNPVLKDPLQDIVLNIGWNNGTHLYANVIRKLITDDDMDEAIYMTSQTSFIYALGDDNILNKISKQHTVFGQFTGSLGYKDMQKCHYMCDQCVGSLINNCQNCSIENVNQIDGYCTKTDLEYPHASEELIEDLFTIHWGYPKIEPNFIYFVFEISMCDWFGIGFGPDMINTDMVLFRRRSKPASNTSFDLDQEGLYYMEVQDLYSKEKEIPLSDNKYGGTQDWIMLGWDINKITNRIVVKVKRRLLTYDDYDLAFLKRQIQVSYAFGNQTFDKVQYHGLSYRGHLTLNLQLNDTRTFQTKWERIVYRGHSTLLFILWGLFSDVGIFFSRQMKAYPKYIQVHGIIFMIIIFMTYFYAFAMINLHTHYLWLTQLRQQDSIIILHFSCGIVILTLITFQLVFGWYIKGQLEDRSGSLKIYIVKKYHKICGLVIYISTKINIIIGVIRYEPDYLMYVLTYYFFLFLIIVTIEFLHLFGISLFSHRKRKMYSKVQVERTLIYQRILDRINANQSRHSIVKAFPKTYYVLLREAVYDISDFQHPGGRFIFDSVRGQEIGRYFYGGYGFQNKSQSQHVHSEFAINYLEKRYIGSYLNECCPLLYTLESIRNAQPQNNGQNNESSKDLQFSRKYLWKQMNKVVFSPNISIFVYQSTYFYVRQQLTGVEWFGKYFYIKPYITGTLINERPYSIVLCMTKENITIRQRIIDFFNFHIHGTRINKDTIYPEWTQYSQQLCFFIKKQPKSKKLSLFLHESYHKTFELTGPYGLGLGLNQMSKGMHYIFCGGTGILPFLDLFEFLLKRYFYTILYNAKGEHIANQMYDYFQYLLLRLPPYYEQKILPMNIFKSNFKVSLCVAVSSQEDFFGRELITDLYILSKRSRDPFFDVHVRYGNGQHDPILPSVTSLFDTSFLVGLMKQDHSKIYVCGSPKFEEFIYNSLKINQIPEKKIIRI